MPAHILVVEDDATLSATILELLGNKGYSVEAAHGLEEASSKLAAGDFDLVVADVGLPDGSGALLTRGTGGATVVLMSGDDSETEVVQGLEAGAVDYLVKPFSAEILIARVELALRHRRSDLAVEHRIGPYRFSPSERRLTIDGREIQLTRREVDILRHLLVQGGPVHRTSLLKDVWKYSPAVATHTVETHIYRLRRKMERDPKQPRILVSEAGGYALLVD